MQQAGYLESSSPVNWVIPVGSLWLPVSSALLKALHYTWNKNNMDDDDAVAIVYEPINHMFLVYYRTNNIVIAMQIYYFLLP